MLNVAIEPSAIGSNFNQSIMEIDYVRVYQENALSNSNPENLEDIIIYPNPTTTLLTIKISEKNIGVQAKIYSILGQELNSSILKT